MDRSPPHAGRWSDIFSKGLGFIQASLEQVRDGREQESRDATPEVALSEELRPHSFKMEYEQIACQHTPDEIRAACQTIQDPAFYCISMSYQLQALTERVPSEGAKWDISALRRAAECLSDFLRSIDVDPQEVLLKVKIQELWEPQVEALKAFERRELAKKAHSEFAADDEFVAQVRARGRPAAPLPARANERGTRHKSRQPTTTDGTMSKPGRTATGRVAKKPAAPAKKKEAGHGYKLRNRDKGGAA